MRIPWGRRVLRDLDRKRRPRSDKDRTGVFGARWPGTITLLWRGWEKSQVRRISRRSFLQSASAVACASCGSFAHAEHAQARARLELQRFAYRDVTLMPGALLDQHVHQQKLFVGIDDDALLKPFRVRAGQDAPGADMGGWYDASADFRIDPNDWASANWHGFIPGHSFGQYLSGLARGFAASGDAVTQKKINRLVDGFAASISPKFFDDYNLPCYTYDKVAIGLIDAWQFASAPGARDALAKTTEAALPWLPKKALTREERRALPYEREAQIWDEPYTLPENLYLATQAGLGDRYRSLAARFLADDSLFDALAQNRSPFKGKHAYSHVNSLSSAFQAWQDTGNDKYLRAARNGFAFVEAQTYATGGWGPNEELLAADDHETLYSMLSDTHRSFETPCGAYAHFKIARSLLQATRDSAYGDSMERVLYNTVLGALPTLADGSTFYYSDYSSKARKVYRGEKWPCCSGTFVQLAADYGISAWLSDADGVYVNLYMPSHATAHIHGQRVRIEQSTQYPFANSSRLALDLARPMAFDLKLRIPAWAGPATRLRVNGKPLAAPIAAGSFHALRRTWKRGDVVDIEFDMRPRLMPLNAAHPEMVALMNGPLALFPTAAPDATCTRAELLRAHAGENHEWRVESARAPMTLKPFAAIRDEDYRLYSRVTA